MIKENLIFQCIVGSQAYGTAIATSDIDCKGVYVQSLKDILLLNKYKPQVEIGKDICFYEVRRFLELLQTANPTVLELLYMPEECIQYKSRKFDLITKHRDKFLTKKCRASFAGYAIQQIKKAKGLDKKMNWENQRIVRKTPLDFCYIYEDGKTMPVQKWLDREKLKQEFCGLAALDHFKDAYALYYDHVAEYGQKVNRQYQLLGYKGIVLEDSNELRLSSVPKGQRSETILYYNKDAYSMHCKDFNEYTTWLENRNTQRYVDTKDHNQKIDGKNMLHCRRLLDMAKEIAQQKTINVKRPNADYLLKIRRGEVRLDEIIEQAENDIKELDSLFINSNLPDEVNIDILNEILYDIRLPKVLRWFIK